MSDETTYPEHEKVQRVREKSQAVGEFLDWIGDRKGWFLAEYPDDSACASKVYIDDQRLLAEFFGIDYDELMAEKDRMLEEIRAAQGIR